MKYIIICICENNGVIVSVGGTALPGPIFHLDREAVADMINNGAKFYTMSNGQTAEVRVYDQARKFIKTWADGEWNDNLDNLPRCKNCQ